MNRNDLLAQARRLDELARGFAKEVTLWKGSNDPLLYLERKAYLVAIQDALAGMENARTILARACQRLEKDPYPLAPVLGSEGSGVSSETSQALSPQAPFPRILGRRE